MTKYREIRRLSGTTLGAAFELGRPWIGGHGLELIVATKVSKQFSSVL